MARTLTNNQLWNKGDDSIFSFSQKQKRFLIRVLDSGLRRNDE